MAIKLPSNLHRNRHGILYFRLSIPRDIQRHFEIKEFYQSLRTSSIRQAAGAAQTLSITLKRLFQELRTQAMTDNNKKATSEIWDEFQRLPDLRVRLKAAGLKIAADELDAELAQREQLIANLELERERDSERHKRELLLVSAAAHAPGPGTAKPTSPCRPLSTYVESYLSNINANREEHDRINQQGLDDHRHTCKVLIEIIGDKALGNLTIQDRNRYDEIIKRYPFNREKVKNTRGKTLADILEMTDYKPISLKTAKFHGSRANAFLYWVFRQEGLTVPFRVLEDVRIKKGKGVDKKRREFNEEELRLLFNPATFPTYGKHDRQSPYKFWIPLIGLHTGARINEIAQLRLTDLVTVDGIPCFSITDLPDPEEEKSGSTYLEKTVKTYAAKRNVPIHSKLLELGLLEYSKAVQAQGYTMLFEDLAHAETKYGSLVSKWFANHCAKLGLTDVTLTFHSFRHGAIGHLRRKKVPKELRKIVVGHSAAEDTHDDYGDIRNDFSLKDRQAAIEELDFSDALDFNALQTKTPSIESLNKVVLRNAKVKQHGTSA